MNYFESFKSNMPWLEAKTIFLTRHGSHAYGTNTETSDIDVKGVAIPPKEYFLGFSKKFEQAESKDPTDLVIYELRKFMSLAADCNPNICEVLWTDEVDWINISPAGRLLQDNKQLFISKKARYTFSGYAISQLKRINLHYRWLKSPPLSPPLRSEYGLPERTVIPKDQLAAAESTIKAKVDSWELDLSTLEDAARIHVMSQVNNTLSEIASVAVMKNTEDMKWRVASELMGYDENFIDLLDRERKYRVKHKEWEQYQNWKASRNPKRAELEEKFGYDTKHAYHLVRLLRMCREILTTGKVIVKRPDRDELLAIRNGAWTYENLIEWAEAQDKEMDSLYKTSTLQRGPDLAALDQLCINIVEATL